MRFRFVRVALALVIAGALPACNSGAPKSRTAAGQAEAQSNAGRGRSVYIAQ